MGHTHPALARSTLSSAVPMASPRLIQSLHPSDGEAAPTVDEALAALEDISRRVEMLRSTMRLALGGATREPAPRATLPATAGVHLEIDGARAGRRSAVRVNGALVELQDSAFLVFVRYLVFFLRSPGSWATKSDLGIANSGWMTSRVRCAFKKAVPAGFQLIESDGRERFRLNPEVVVAQADWAALDEHPEPAVRTAAAQRGGRIGPHVSPMGKS
jgi:hypothetical protein